MGRHNKALIKQSKTNVGMRFEFFTCPLCGFSRSLQKYLDRRIQFNQTNLRNYQIYQIREGGGYASGFHRINGKTLEELKNNEDFQDIIKDIIEQCNKILKCLK